MDIGPEEEIIEVEEPTLPYEGEEVDPGFRPEEETEREDEHEPVPA